MSYILEALKKADQQRELGKVPGIDTGHDIGRKPLARHWPWLVAVLLLVNALVVAILFWPDTLEDSGQPPAEVVQAPVVDSPVPRRQVEAPSVVQQSRALRPIPVPAPVKPSEPESEPIPAGIDPDAARLALARSLLPSTPDGTLAPAQPVPEPAPQARIATREELPVWPQIPQNLFRQLSGGIHLDVHVYADSPGNRFVLINMRKYYEGERLQEGPVLDEITPEGAVLSFQGERFLLQAQ